MFLPPSSLSITALLLSLCRFDFASGLVEGSATAVEKNTTTATSVASSSVTPYFADNYYGSGRGLFMHPRGQHYNGVTYLAYQGPGEASYIVAYNHTSKLWDGPIKVLDNPMGGVNPEILGKQADNHGSPQIAITRDGYINIFASGHGGCDKEIPGYPMWGNNPYGEGCKYRKPFPNDPSHIGIQRHARSLKAENIYEWEQIPLEESGLSPYSSYGQNVITKHGPDKDEELITLITRHGPHTGDWVYHTSSDGGKTFTAAVPFVKYEQVEKKKFVTWYVNAFGATKYATKKQGAIGIILSWHNHDVSTAYEDGSKSHGPDRRNVYYIELNPKKGKIYNVEGLELDLPLTLETANQHALVFETESQQYAHPQMGNFNKRGEPEILFQTYEKCDFIGWTACTYLNPKNFYTKWNKGEKEWHKITPLPTISEGGSQATFVVVNRDREVSNVMLWSDQALHFYRSGLSKNEIFFTQDGEIPLQPGSRGVEWLRNAHRDAHTLVFDAAGRTDTWNDYYRAAYLVGIDGFLERDTTESTDLWQRCFYDAKNEDECFAICPPETKKKILRVELDAGENVETIQYNIKCMEDSKWNDIVTMEATDFPYSSEICTAMPSIWSFPSSLCTFELQIGRKSDGLYSEGTFKVTYGDDVLWEGDLRRGGTYRHLVNE